MDIQQETGGEKENAVVTMAAYVSRWEILKQKIEKRGLDSGARSEILLLAAYQASVGQFIEGGRARANYQLATQSMASFARGAVENVDQQLLEYMLTTADRHVADLDLAMQKNSFYREERNKIQKPE